VDTYNNQIVKVSPSGKTFTVLAGSSDKALAPIISGCSAFDVDRAGNMYLASWKTHYIHKISQNGTLTKLSNEPFRNVYDLKISIDGSCIFLESYQHTIKQISPNGKVSTIAGGAPGFVDGPSHDARFYYPNALALALDNTIFVADTGNSVLRVITPQREVRTIAINGQAAKIGRPMGVAWDEKGKFILVADFETHRILRLLPEMIFVNK